MKYLVIAIIFAAIRLCFAQTNNPVPVKSEAFFHQIKWADLNKSEFESKTEYTNRINSLFDFAGEKIWIEVSDTATLFTYNAEEKKAALGLRFGPDVFCVCSTNFNTYHSVEQNAYGAKIDVTHYMQKLAELRLINASQLPKSIKPVESGIPLGLVFPLDAKKAKELTAKNNLRLEIYVEIQSMVTAKKYVDGASATFDSPTSILSYHYEVPAKLLGLKATDLVTSETLAEWPNNKGF